MGKTVSRRRPQFTLLNLLFLATTVAAVAGLYGSWQTILQQKADHATREAELLAELSPIREENAKLRAEQGALTIEDPDKVHAIQIVDPRDGVWSYRVYLPPGHSYYLAGQANNLPMNGEAPRYGPGPPPGLSMTKSGVSDRGGAMTANGCSSGEHLVSIALTRNDQGKKIFRVDMMPTTPGSDGANIGMGIREDPGKWPAVELDPPDRTRPSLGSMETGVPAQRQTIRPVDAKPLVLLEKRFMHGDITSSADSDEGLIVWIGRADEKP